MDRLALSVELSSEAPGVNNNWPSDISFFLNVSGLEAGEPRGFRGCSRDFYPGLVDGKFKPIRPAETH